MSAIGRNNECPCGSGLKFKKCCLGKQSWEQILREPVSEQIRHLSIRGKNIYFLGCILGALQVDTLRPDIQFSKLKKAFTPAVVRHIHQSVVRVWPDLRDYEDCHLRDRNSVSSLYTGSYEPEAIFQAVARHALYSERIYLVDPFLYPSRLRNEFNPLVHPEEHRANAIKFTFLWMTLFPWIEAGIVNFIRSPVDFVPGLDQEIFRIQREKFDSCPELRSVMEKETDAELKERMDARDGMTEWYWLAHSDEWHAQKYRQYPGKKPFPTSEEFLQYIQHRRENHPYYVDRLPDQNAEFLHETSGANYELAKRICSITGSHLITGLKTRWKEIELDREASGIDMAGWSPFAKALQNSELKVLNNVSLDTALSIRRENRLESLRYFFYRVWKSCGDPDAFSEANATNLTAELDERIREAKGEWDKISQDLVKWFGAPGAAILSAGLTGFLPSAPAQATAVATGAAGLIQSYLRRSSFKERFPAGFFLTIKK
jgi:hypothetical protein